LSDQPRFEKNGEMLPGKFMMQGHSMAKYHKPASRVLPCNSLENI